MMYNTRYLPENFEQCRLMKTILRHFPYNLNVRTRWIAFNQDSGKTMKVLIRMTPVVLTDHISTKLPLPLHTHWPNI